MTTETLLALAAAWVLIGVLTAVVMRRRGHDLRVWLALGIVLGPLIVPLAVERVRYHEAAHRESRAVPTPPSDGFDVLAGVDGSHQSVRAIESAMHLFGDLMTSVTLAKVLDFDAESAAADPEPKQKAREMLEELASRIDGDRVGTEILFGRADTALVEFARVNGIDLIVVGARGHGAAETLFGSTTERLVGDSELPVYVGPTPHSPGEPPD